MKHTHGLTKITHVIIQRLLTIWIKQKSWYVFAQMVALAVGTAFLGSYPAAGGKQTFDFCAVNQTTITVSSFQIIKLKKGCALGVKHMQRMIT